VVILVQKPSALLVFSTSYTSRQIAERKLEVYLTSRDTNQIFDRIIFVNPLSELQDNLESPYQNHYPKITKMNGNLIYIDGGVTVLNKTNITPKLFFVIAQLKLLFTVLGVVRHYRICLVRGEDPRFAGAYAWIFATIFRLNLIIGVWGNPSRIRKDTGRPMSPKLFKSSTSEERFERRILAQANKVLVQNSENKSYTENMGVEQEKVTISALGVGIYQEHYSSLSGRKLDKSLDFSQLLDSEFTIVFLSRLEEVKHCHDILEVASILFEAGMDFKIFFIGDGSLKSDLQLHAAQRGLGKVCVFLGNKDQHWISRFLVNVDLALAPLLGRALIEIGLAGIPVVAYSVDWHADLVEDEVTGFLVPLNDFSQMAEMARYVLENREIRTKLSRNIRERSLYIANPQEQATNQAILYRSLAKKL